MTIIGIIIAVIGLFFITVSSIGLVRLPDFYTRAHAVGKSETLGAILIVLGLAVYNGFQISSIKLIIILLFIALANPTATHAIARAAFRCNIEPIFKRKIETHGDDNKTSE